MEPVTNLDALAYLIAAQSVLAVLFILAGLSALGLGIWLYRRSVTDMREDPDSEDYVIRRLIKDTWLPRGTLTKNEEDDPRFLTTPKDMWVPRGTLVKTPLNLSTSQKQQAISLAVMASSLLWGFAAYWISPVNIEEINAKLAGIQEHKIQAHLQGLREDVQRVIGQVDQLRGGVEETVSQRADEIKQVAEQMENSVQTLHTQVAGGLDTLHTAMDDQNTRQERLENHVQALPARLKSLENTVHDEHSAIAGNHAALDTVRQNLITNNDQLQALQSAVVRLEDHLRNDSGERDTHLAELTQAQQASGRSLATVRDSTGQLHSELQALQEAWLPMAENVQQLSTVRASDAARFSRIDNELQSLHAALTPLAHSMQQLVAQRETPDVTRFNALDTALQTLGTDMAGMRTTLQGVENGLAAQQTQIANRFQVLTEWSHSAAEHSAVLRESLRSLQVALAELNGPRPAPAMPPQLSDKLSRIHNVTQTLYEAITELQTRTTAQAEQMLGLETALSALQAQTAGFRGILQDTRQTPPPASQPAWENPGAAENSALADNVQTLSGEVHALKQHTLTLQTEVGRLLRSMDTVTQAIFKSAEKTAPAATEPQPNDPAWTAADIPAPNDAPLPETVPPAAPLMGETENGENREIPQSAQAESPPLEQEGQEEFSKPENASPPAKETVASDDQAQSTLLPAEEAAAPASPPPPETAPPAPNAVALTLLAKDTPQLKNWGPYVDIAIDFRTGSVKELQDNTPLDELGAALQQPDLHGKRILLQGYTDSSGSWARNQELSGQRARFVKQYLVQHFGLEAKRIIAEGKGEANPVASNDTAEGRKQNRRIRVAVKP